MTARAQRVDRLDSAQIAAAPEVSDTRGTVKVTPRAAVRRWVVRAAVAIPLGVVLGTSLALASYRPPADAYGDRTLLVDGPVSAVVGEVAMTDSMRLFDRTVRIGEHDAGLILDRTPIECHGGRARATWYVGNLEPTVPETGLHLAVRLDGAIVAGMIEGSYTGSYEDGPVSIEAIFDCTQGEHVIDVYVVSIRGGWGIPYVANVPRTDSPVSRGFIVTEVMGTR